MHTTLEFYLLEKRLKVENDVETKQESKNKDCIFSGDPYSGKNRVLGDRH